MSTKDLVYGAHVSLKCMDCKCVVDFVGMDYTAGNFRESIGSEIRESMVIHKRNDLCGYEDEDRDKELYSKTNLGENIEDVAGWGHLLLFARAVRRDERRRKK